MRNSFGLFASVAVSGILLVAANFFTLPSISLQQTAPEGTQVAAMATMASAQATIANRLDQGITVTINGGESANGPSAVIPKLIPKDYISPTIEPLAPAEDNSINSRVIFFDGGGNKVPPPIEIKINKAILVEKFDNDQANPGWLFQDKRWVVANGGLTMSGFTGDNTLDMLAFLPVLISGNYEAEFTFNWLSHQPDYGSGYFAIDFGETRSFQHPYFLESGIDEPGARIRLQIDTSTIGDVGIIELSRMSPLSDWSDKPFWWNKGMFVVPGKHRIKLTKQNNHYIIYLNGNQIVDYENTDIKEPDIPVALYIGMKYTSGIGVNVNNGTPPVFDDFIIRILE